MRFELAIVTGLLTLASIARGQEPAQPAAGENAEIRAAGRAFVEAFNAGNAKALAAMFTERAEIVEEEDEPVQGREAIQARFEALFEELSGVKLDVKAGKTNTLDPNLVIEEETVTLTVPGDPPVVDVSRDSVTYLRENGKWLIARIQDLHPDEKSLTPHDYLKELDWMTGDWVSESHEGIVRTSCAWDHGGNYLLRSYTIRVEGKPTLTGTQRIGWDPVSKQIKSWVFDSDGGHGEGLWSRDGDRWVIKAHGVRADGTPVTATRVLTFVDDDHARWTSLDRTVGGIASPDVDEYSLVRTPPMPK